MNTNLTDHIFDPDYTAEKPDSFSNEVLTQTSLEDKPKPSVLIYFLFGNSALLAFNIAINAIDIFKPLFTELNLNIGVAISRAYNIPSAVIALLLIFFKPKNLKISISVALIALILVMCTMPILFSIQSLKDNAKTLYWIVVVLLGCTGFFSSLLLSSTYAFASQCGPAASTAVSSGNGACGVIAAFLRIITKAALSKNETISSILYYSVAGLILFLTLIYFFIAIKRNDILNSYLIHQSSENDFSLKQIFVTIRIIWVEWISVAINFIITLVLFPGYVTDIREGKLKDWNTVLITAMFCIFDWVGRYLPAVKLWPQRKFAWITVLSRLLFFPIFMISIQGVINLGEPYWSIFWQIPFAITNGYCGTTSLIYGSNHENLANSQQKQLASFLISFAINAGIFTAMFMTYLMPDGKQR